MAPGSPRFARDDDASDPKEVQTIWERFGLLLETLLLLSLLFHNQHCVAETLTRPNNAGTSIFSPVMNSNKLRWLIQSKYRGPTRAVTVSLLDGSGSQYEVRWRKAFDDGYEPNTYYVPRWTYNFKSILLLQYKRGAAWSIMTVIGLGKHGPVVVQQLEAGSFDVTYVTSSDGNGDLRSIDGSLPLTHHCYDWSQSQSKFTETACRTLLDEPARP